MAILRPYYRVALCLCISLLLSACVNQTIKSTSVPAVKTPGSAVTEEQLLDVAVVVFDPGLDDYDEDEQVYPEVRKAEARFMPLQLSQAMQDSGAWGAVRVVPDDGEVNDLIVTDNGAVQAVILGVGGFLGIGEKDVAVAMRAIEMQPDGDSVKLVVDASKDQLNSAPGYDRTKRVYVN